MIIYLGISLESVNLPYHQRLRIIYWMMESLKGILVLIIIIHQTCLQRK